MPIYASTYNGLNIQPNIIPPSAGDLEEARIRRLMDTAKLYNLQQEPLQNQRMYDLQKAQLAETTGYHSAEISDRATGRNLEARGQDITMRGQDLSSQEHADALKTATVNNILSHAISRPDIPLSVYADTARQFGFPELGSSLATHGNELQNEKAKTLAAGLVVASTSKNPNDYPEQLTALKNHPEAADLLPRIRSTIGQKYPNIAKDLDPTKSGVQTTIPGDYNDPEIAAALIRQREQQRVETEQAAKVKNFQGRFQLRKRLGLEEGYDPTKPYPGYLH